MSQTPKREQRGGVIYEDGRPVGYTKEGAEPAIPGGPVDSTVQPDFLVNDLEALKAGQQPVEQINPAEGAADTEGEPGVSREDAAPLTGEEASKTTTRRRSS